VWGHDVGCGHPSLPRRALARNPAATMATNRRAPPATPATAARLGGVDSRGSPSRRSATLPTRGADAAAAAVARVEGSAAEVAAGGAGSAAEALAWDAGSGPARRPGRESGYWDEFAWCREVPVAERLWSDPGPPDPEPDLPDPDPDPPEPEPDLAGPEPRPVSPDPDASDPDPAEPDPDPAESEGAVPVAGPWSARAGATQAGTVRRVARVRVARRVRTWGWSFPGGAGYVLAIAGWVGSLQ
jgi:hypothetical protein